MLASGLHYTPRADPGATGIVSGCGSRAPPHTHEVITMRIGEAHIIDGREFIAEGRDSFPPIPVAEDWRITAITPFQDDVTV